MAIKTTDIPEYLETPSTPKKDREVVVEKSTRIEKAPANPVFQKRKVPITIRLDLEIIEFFESGGRGWHTRINEVLHNYMEK